VRKQQPLRFTENVEDTFTGRLLKVRRQALIKAFLLDFVFAYYLAFAVVTLYQFFVHDKAGLENSTFLTLFPISLVVAALFFFATRSLGQNLIFRSHKMLKSQEMTPFSWTGSVAGWHGISLLAFTFILGWVLTEVDLYLLVSAEGIAGAQRIFSSLITPNWGIFNMVINAMIVTIFIAFTATVTAIPIAFVLSFMCSRNLMNFSAGSMGVYSFLRFIFNFTRSVEPLIWAIIFSVWVGIGPFAGMIALMLHSIASLAKLYSEQIESIDRGPMEAIEATGASRVQTIWYSVVPQIILPFLSYTIYRWDINIRMATIIGLVGGGGVGTLLMQYQGIARWNEVGTIIITIAVVVWVMDYISAKVREAIY
jgi:phosphonate transport system permease protein